MLRQLYELFWQSRVNESIWFNSCCVLGILLALVCFLLFRKWKNLSRNEVVVLGVLWTLFCTAQYWALGPYSFIGLSEEIIAGVPWLVYLTHTPSGEAFSFAWSGGVDKDGAIVLSTQYIGIERLLFSLLPFGVALALMKMGAVALSYAGTYRLTRTAFGISRGQAVVLAMISGVGSSLNLGYVLGGNAWGFALLPSAFYFLCLRTHQPRYFLGVAAFSVFFSSATSLFHQFPMTLVAVLLGAFLVPPRSYRRFAGGIVLFTAVFIANWSKIFLVIVQLGPESFRVQSVQASSHNPLSLLFQVVHSLSDIYVFFVGFFALGVLAFYRDRIFFRALAAYLVAVGIGPLLCAFDWKQIPIAFLSAYRWDQLSYSNSLTVLILAALALRHLKATFRWRGVLLPTASTVYLVSLAAWAAGALKFEDFRRYEGWGGQAQLLQAGIFSDRDWRPREPFRVVTVGASLYPNLGNAHGLDTFDGISNSMGTRSTLYFGLAVQKRDLPFSSSWNLLQVPITESTLGSTANLDALRVANVRFVMSDRLLEDAQLKRVLQKPAFETKGNSWFRNLSAQLAPVLYTRTHYLYEIPDPWPRVFIPKRLQVSSASIESRGFYRQILDSKAAVKGVVSSADVQAHHLQPSQWDPLAYRLKNFLSVLNGFDAHLVRNKPNSVGILVANVPYTRFWSARSAGHALEVFPINGVQLGIVLRDTDDKVEIRYQR